LVFSEVRPGIEDEQHRKALAEEILRMDAAPDTVKQAATELLEEGMP
jgi:hypothetical protein